MMLFKLVGGVLAIHFPPIYDGDAPRQKQMKSEEEIEKEKMADLDPVSDDGEVHLESPE